MSTNLDRVRIEAMRLSDVERAELARDLVKSLDAPDDAGASDAWDREVSRRLAAIDDDTAKLVDREEFRRRIRARLTSI